MDRLRGKKEKSGFSVFPGTTGDKQPSLYNNKLLYKEHSPKEKGRKNTISKEIVGKGVSTTPFPTLHRDSPTQIPDPGDALCFFLDFNGRNPPTATAQEKQVAVGKDGKPRFYDPPRVKRARADICARLERFAPDAPFEGPVVLRVEWRLVNTKRLFGWHTDRLDTDNLQKLLKDCMTRTRFWLDDGQVSMETVLKVWDPKPGIEIEVKPLA